jgi:alpha/beta superfamily hydrolase
MMMPPNSRRLFIYIALFLLSFSACQKADIIPTPTSMPKPTDTPTLIPSPTPYMEVVSLTTEDNVKLSGTLYPAGGDMAVIFAHMGILDQTSWQPFAKQVADQGISAFTFDFRCFGNSECIGGNTEFRHIQDIISVIQFLRHRGYSRLVCVGASMGAIACINASVRENLVGLAVIASGKHFAIADKSFPEDLVNPAMPKLYIYTDQDRYEVVRTAMPELYEKSPDPKERIVFGGEEHGTELFDSQKASEFNKLLMEFLIELSATYN